MVTPPEEPGDPEFPIAKKIIIAGFFASLLFAMVAGVARDIASGTIFEALQVRRQLGLPVLGTVKA